MTDPDDNQGNRKSQATILVSSIDSPSIKFPPFPTQPNVGEGTSIISFKHFKEHGIRIFSDTGVEVDGLGIPTVELAVIHDLDECKTETRRKLKDGKNKLEGKRGKTATAVGEAPLEGAVKLSPMEKAKDRRTQRFLLFAKKEWFDQWSEGEHLRGLKTYDPYALNSIYSITLPHFFYLQESLKYYPHPSSIHRFSYRSHLATCTNTADVSLGPSTLSCYIYI